MSTLETIREQIKHLYETNPEIHMNVTLDNPRTVLKNTPATITGVYPYIFRIEESTSGKKKMHTLQYSDILIKKIVILELNPERAEAEENEAEEDTETETEPEEDDEE